MSAVNYPLGDRDRVAESDVLWHASVGGTQCERASWLVRLINLT